VTESIALKPRRAVPAGRRLWERILYLANPLRSCNSYPRAVRDSDLWERVWTSADPVRHWYWRLKNAAHPVPPGSLTERGRAMLQALRDDGIAIHPGFVAPELLTRMENTARSYARAGAGIDVDAPKPEQQCHLNNMGNDLAPDDPIMTFLRSDEVLAIAGRHLGFAPRLRRLALFFNQPQRDLSGPDNVEKHFHADNHDFRILKLFIYLRDTGPRNGPFTYVRGTHFHGTRRGLVGRLPSYSEISAEEMESFVPREAWVLATGPAGTAIFAETSGVHRGGRAEEGQRLMLVAEYASRHPWVRFDHDIAE
jgi:hypothetical protein